LLNQIVETIPFDLLLLYQRANENDLAGQEIESDVVRMRQWRGTGDPQSLGLP